MQLGDVFVVALAFAIFGAIFFFIKSNRAAYDDGYDDGYDDCLEEIRNDFGLEYRQGYEDGYADGSKKAA